jgi:hypothetical protein
VPSVLRHIGKSTFPWTRDRGNPGQKPRHNLRRPFRGTGVIDLKRVGIAVIGKLEFLRTRKLGHRKSRNPRGIETIHMEGRMVAISFIGKNPNKEVVHRCLVHRDIGDPGDKLFVHFGIAKRNIPMSGGHLSTHHG